MAVQSRSGLQLTAAHAQTHTGRLLLLHAAARRLLLHLLLATARLSHALAQIHKLESNRGKQRESGVSRGKAERMLRAADCCDCCLLLLLLAAIGAAASRVLG